MIAIAISWALIGAITCAGMFAEFHFIDERRRHAQDYWQVPACLLGMMVAWPAAYAVWWVKVGKGGRADG